MVSLTVFACGNPSRGDDALAPLLLERLEPRFADQPKITFLTDFQWQIEHAEDLRQCDCALFIDADASLAVPWHLEAVTPETVGYTSHALSPAALLGIYRQTYPTPPPPAYVLRLRGTDFTLGHSLSTTAQASLEQVENVVMQWLRAEDRLAALRAAAGLGK